MMERLGITLAGAPVFGWHDVAVWARHLPTGSAVWRALNPKQAAFASDVGRAYIMADQFDATMHVIKAIASAAGGRPRDPKPYPRPGKDEGGHFGSDPIPAGEFDAWFYSED